MLSLCMIVKNEEVNIKMCLLKAAPIVDEIIVVDTGSVDNTFNIVQEFTDKVYSYQWCNNFSVARNFSISKAKNEWILVLDADEYVSEFSLEKINTFISNKRNQTTVGRIGRINIIDDNTGSRKYSERISRLFNKNYFRYEGSIHEQIVSIDGTPYNTLPIDIIVYHEGYTREAVNRTNKLKRNEEMLKQAIILNPDDPYLYFQLGKTYYVLKNYQEASSYFEKALSFELDSRLEYVEDLIETYGYTLMNSERYSDAMILKNCRNAYKHSPDFHFLMGLIYMNNAKFNEAVESFTECTRFSHGKAEGITTFLPCYNIGVIYEVLEYKDIARKYYSLCGQYQPAAARLMDLEK